MSKAEHKELLMVPKTRKVNLTGECKTVVASESIMVSLLSMLHSIYSLLSERQNRCIIFVFMINFKEVLTFFLWIMLFVYSFLTKCICIIVFHCTFQHLWLCSYVLCQAGSQARSSSKNTMGRLLYQHEGQTYSERSTGNVLV